MHQDGESSAANQATRGGAGYASVSGAGAGDDGLDRYRLYELCVQSPGHVAAFLHAVHGRGPVRMDEDFCGSASVSRAWVADTLVAGALVAGVAGVGGVGGVAGAAGERRAVGMDLDAETIDAAGKLAAEQGVNAARLRLVVGDCTRARGDEDGGIAADAGGADVVFVGNFSIGYIHTRAALVAYLRLCHQRLAARGGVFVCDLYGGASAYIPGGGTRRFAWPDGQTAHYTWQNETADVRTAMVRNTISFRLAIGVGDKPEVTAEWPDAFVYEWRLWGLAELREAMAEAGFATSEVYLDYRVGQDGRVREVASGEEMPGDWVVLLAARG